MVKISGFYLYSIRSYSALKMAENCRCIKLRVPLCCSVGHNSSDFDNLELKFCISSSYTFYFTCAKNQTNLRGSGGGLSKNWLISYGMTRVSVTAAILTTRYKLSLPLGDNATAGMECIEGSAIYLKSTGISLQTYTLTVVQRPMHS